MEGPGVKNKGLNCSPYNAWWINENMMLRGIESKSGSLVSNFKGEREER